MEKVNLRFILEEWLCAVWMVLAVVGLGAFIALNSTFIYRIIVDYYELTIPTGLNREILMMNYLELIRYLQLPWILELYLSDFEMSVTGRLHFEAVKGIFQILYLGVISFTIVLPSMIKRLRILSILNKGANLIIVAFGLFGSLMIFDFDIAFLWFHKVLFRHDYWLFNATTDPVILALPEELFFIMGIFILVLLFGMAGVVKFLYFRERKKSYIHMFD